MLFAALGIPIYGVREIAKVSNDKNKLSKLFFEIITINVITSFLVVMIYITIICNIEKFTSHRSIYYLGAFYIFINSFSIEWFYNGISEFKYLAIRTIAVRILSIVALFLFVKTKDDLFVFFAINVFVLLLNNFLNLIYLRNKITLFFHNLEFKSHLKPLVMFFLSSLAISLYSLLDTIILGFVKSDYFVGLYALGSKVNKIPTSFIIAVGAVFLPKLVQRHASQDKIGFDNLVKESLQFIIIFSVPICFFIYSNSRGLIELLSNQNFVEANTSLQIMSPLTFLIGLSYFFGMQILLTFGEEKKLLLSVTVGTILSVFLNILLIPSFNDQGAAIANVLCELLVVTLTGYFAAKHIAFDGIIRLFFLQFLIYGLLVCLLKVIFGEHHDVAFILVSQSLLFCIVFYFLNVYVYKITFMTEINHRLISLFK